MLHSVNLSNFIITSDLAIDFSSGFTVFTGATGAGKSIILKALAIACGQEKAQTSHLKPGSERCVITATFTLDAKLAALLTDYGIAGSEEDTIILRRVITLSGAKAFINDVPVGVTLLKNVGEQLLDIHQQFDTQKLLLPKNHLAILDTMINPQTVAAVEEAWSAFKKCQMRLTTLVEQTQNLEERQSYLNFVIAELEAAEVKEGEEEELLAQRKLVSEQEKLQNALSKVETALEGSSSRGMGTALRALLALEDVLEGNSIYTALGEKIQHTYAELLDIEELLQDLKHTVLGANIASLSINDLENRLITIRSLAKKHHVRPDELPQVLENLKGELNTLTFSHSELEQAKQCLSSLEQDYQVKAQVLSSERKEVAAKFAAQINKELNFLHLKNMHFMVNIQPQVGVHPSGTDEVTFEVLNNLNPKPQSIAKAASGGELARIMLAVKAVMSSFSSPAAVLFDEIDTGVGGEVAHAIGLKLRDLSKFAQVIAVTHSHQVAALGEHHYLVDKSASGSSVTTKVKMLEASERVLEVARMISAQEVTEDAKAIAVSLLHK